LATGNGTFNLNGGTLTTNRVRVGWRGAGTFNQIAGTHQSGTFFSVAELAGSTGTYSLSGTGELRSDYISVGASGTGIFNQTGGTHDVGSELAVGEYSGSQGTYRQTAGTTMVHGDLYLGQESNASGRYELEEPAVCWPSMRGSVEWAREPSSRLVEPTPSRSTFSWVQRLAPAERTNCEVGCSHPAALTWASRVPALLRRARNAQRELHLRGLRIRFAWSVHHLRRQPLGHKHVCRVARKWGVSH